MRRRGGAKRRGVWFMAQGTDHGRDLTQEARDGVLPCFEFSDSDRDFIEQFLPALRDVGVGLLVGLSGVGKSTAIYNLAGAVAEGNAPPDFIDRRLIQAPSLVDALERFVESAPDFADRRDIVVLEIDEIYASCQSGDSDDKRIASALTRLFAEGELWIIAIGTNEVVEERLQANRFVFQTRLDARDGVISFCVRLIDGERPVQRLMFRLALTAAQTLVAQVTAPPGHPPVSIEVLLEELVRYMREGRHKDQSNHTVLAGAALAVFSSGLLLRAGHSHVLTIDAVGQRYRIRRAYVYDEDEFTGP
jgi:hypothetical protein